MPEGSTRRGREEVCRILLHIAAKLRALSKKISLFFSIENMGGGGTIKKKRPPQKERKKHKKV